MVCTKDGRMTLGLVLDGSMALGLVLDGRMALAWFQGRIQTTLRGGTLGAKAG